MRLTTETGDYVVLEPQLEGDAADLALVVRMSRDGFTAMAAPWIERDKWFAFAQALTILEERRQGEATVESMSPGELALTIRSVNNRGHLGVEGLLGKREFDREISLRFSVFVFDPSQIVPFAQEARRISEWLGSRRRVIS